MKEKGTLNISAKMGQIDWTVYMGEPGKQT